jgi:hypothetical protein
MDNELLHAEHAEEPRTLSFTAFSAPPRSLRQGIFNQGIESVKKFNQHHSKMIHKSMYSFFHGAHIKI